MQNSQDKDTSTHERSRKQPRKLQSTNSCLEKNAYGQIDRVIWLDPTLAEYWQKLFIALRKKLMTNRVLKQLDTGRSDAISPIQYFNFNYIHIRGIEMTKEILMTKICCRRSMNSIKRISFDTTNNNGEGMISLAKLVEQSSELNALDIPDNPINHMNVALYVSRASKFHPCIKNVDMPYRNLGNNPEIQSWITLLGCKQYVIYKSLLSRCYLFFLKYTCDTSRSSNDLVFFRKTQAVSPTSSNQSYWISSP